MTTQFQNRAEQLGDMFQRFIGFIGQILVEMGQPSTELGLLARAPLPLLCGKAVEMNEKYGDELLKGNLAVVYKLIAEQSSKVSYQGVMEEAGEFVKFLEEHEVAKKRFFKLVRLIILIIRSD
jgi:hypothetical protein